MEDNGSYARRHERASEVFARFVPGVSPDRVFASMERRFGALGSFGFDAVGDLWSRPQLSRRDRSLLVIAVLSAQTRDEELELHTQVGLHHGLSRVEIEEVLLHVAAYVGFPAAMAAFQRMDTAFRKAEGVERIEGRRPADRLDDAERDRRAADVRGTLTAGRAAAEPAADLANLQRAIGDVGTLAFRWAFGEIWSRAELSRRDRSLIVIAILGALGQERELAFHVPAGLNHGLTREEIEEVMVHLALYAGFPRAVDGIRAVRAAFAKIDARSTA